jgi:RND family efflux transporter MFP subunit
MKHRWIGVLCVAAVAAAAVAWWWTRPPQVEVVHPRFGPAVQAVYATGTVEPVVMMPIAPRLGARVVSLDVDEGTVVHKGQVLAHLESEDMRNNVAQLVAQEEFARRDLARYAAMVGQGIIARQTYDRAKAAWEAARAAADAARAQAGYMTLVAPADGRIIRRDGEVGEFLPINQPLFWLSCLSRLRISAEVDEEDISLVSIGQKVLIRADAFPGRIFNAHVQEITPKGDPVARSYRVRIAFDTDVPLQIGMTAEANIITHETSRALLVPAAAVSGDHVWVVAGGRLYRRNVQLGVTGRDLVEVRSGLSPTDAIAATSGGAFEDGQQIEPTLAAAP